MRESPISRSSNGRSPLPQGSSVTVARTPRSVVNRLAPGAESVTGAFRARRSAAAGGGG